MSQLVEQDDEIDLGELFATVWYNWWIVGLATIVSVVMSGVYLFSFSVPKYEASSRFELLNRNEGLGNVGQAASFAALAGISLPGSASEADTILDRVLSRPFIDSIYEKAELFSDPVFNVFLQEPGLMSKAIELMSGPGETRELTRDDLLVMAIGSLRERLSVVQRDNGIVELTVTHPSGERAATVANIIVERTLLDIFERERSVARDSLNYFADELLNVRADLDAANAALRDYAITNNLQSAEELARTSGQLAQLRRELNEIDQSIRAISEIRTQWSNGADFAQSHPISSSLSFRRLLNFSGDPNDWSMPSEEKLMHAMDRLTSQKSPLISTISSLEERAKNSGAEALELASLRREVEVQQAVYESVITQFEARSLVSGFERASGRIVETALAPSAPASPRIPLVLALGLVLGILFGIVLVLVVSKWRGTLYTYAAIKDAFGITGENKLKPSRLGQLSSQSLTPRQLSAAQDFLASLDANDQIIPVATPTCVILSARFVMGLSKAATLMGGSYAILDVSGGAFSKLAAHGSKTVENGFNKRSIVGEVDLLEATDLSEYLQDSKCSEHLGVLKEKYDRIFVILPNPEKGTAIARIVSQSMDNMIIIAKRGKTTRAAVDAIRAIFSTKVSDPRLVIV